MFKIGRLMLVLLLAFFVSASEGQSVPPGHRDPRFKMTLVESLEAQIRAKDAIIRDQQIEVNELRQRLADLSADWRRWNAKYSRPTK